MAEYELKAGTLSEGETFMKILDLLRQAETQIDILGHYKKENGDELIGQGFLAIGELIKKVQYNLTKLATGKIRMQ